MSSSTMDEEPLNLCLKDEQRFTDSGNEDRFSSPGVLGTTSSNNSSGDEEDEMEAVTSGDCGPSRTGGGPDTDSSLSVIEQINSLRKFIHEKRLSKFYEMYLMQLRVLAQLIFCCSCCCSFVFVSPSLSLSMDAN